VEMPENNTYTFTEFSDLKTLCSVGYPEYTVLIWAGSGPLVISEDLTLPVNAELQFCDDNAHLIINEGVTFETSNYTNGIYVKILEVKGTFTSRSHFFVEDALSVTGELICNNSFTLRYGAVLTGFENIKFTDDHSHVTWSADVQTLEDVIALAQEAAQSPMDFSVFINSDEDLTLRQDLILPANMEFSVWGSGTFTIPFNRQQLADYLSVDRSAMSLELCKMRDMGMLEFDKNRFRLIETSGAEYGKDDF